MSGPPCPHCVPGTGQVTLLTTMVTYFECGSCASRWHIPTPCGSPAGVLFTYPSTSYIVEVEP